MLCTNHNTEAFLQVARTPTPTQKDVNEKQRWHWDRKQADIYVCACVSTCGITITPIVMAAIISRLNIVFHLYLGSQCNIGKNEENHLQHADPDGLSFFVSSGHGCLRPVISAVCFVVSDSLRLCGK